MVTFIVFAVSLAIIFLLIVFLIAPAKSTKTQRAPFQNRNIAHRGLHNKDKSIPENTLLAFQRAIKEGYGIELDIQFSKDEKIVVFHDNTLLRVCGVDKRVDELTYEELKHLTIYRSTEYIPLFSEVLNLVGGSVPLIIELKNGSKNTLLCKKSYEMLKNYKGNFCIESFQPAIVSWFRKNAKEVFRGQLSAPPSEFKGELRAYEAFFLSNLLSNVKARPQFVAYHKKKSSFFVKLCDLMGAMRFVWTVRDTDDREELESKNDAVIFEFYHPKTKY